MFDETDDDATVLRALELLRRGDAPAELEAMVPALTELANSGDPDAAFVLGGIYMVALDSDELAVEAFEQAGDHPGAMRMLADLVDAGRGVARDELRATQLYADAAALGDMVAQYAMSRRERDPAKARRWLEQSAAQGYADALAALRRST